MTDYLVIDGVDFGATGEVKKKDVDRTFFAIGAANLICIMALQFLMRVDILFVSWHSKETSMLVRKRAQQSDIAANYVKTVGDGSILLIMTLLTTKTVTREQHFGETETNIQFFGLHSCISPVFLSFLHAAILSVMRIVNCNVHIIKPLRGIWDLGSKPMKRLKSLPYLSSATYFSISLPLKTRSMSA